MEFFCLDIVWTISLLNRNWSFFLYYLKSIFLHLILLSLSNINIEAKMFNIQWYFWIFNYIAFDVLEYRPVLDWISTVIDYYWYRIYIFNINLIFIYVDIYRYRYWMKIYHWYLSIYRFYIVNALLELSISMLLIFKNLFDLPLPRLGAEARAEQGELGFLVFPHLQAWA